jgi:hypothetical protein
MTTKLLLAGALIALLILPAGAQQAPQGTPTRILGTVEKLDSQALTGRGKNHVAERFVELQCEILA